MSVPLISPTTCPDAFSKDSGQALVADFVTLLKPGVLLLVVFTGLIGALLAPAPVHPYVLFVSVLSIALGAGGAAAFNMWYDRDIDLVMTRTKTRPIPAGRVAPSDALVYACLLSVTSVTLMALTTYFIAAALLALSIIYYTLFYTVFLKRRTAQNIVIGGGAGAFPPVIGWVAVTGDVSLFPVLMWWIIFIWTPSHFWALALYRYSDYEKARVPMLPVTRGLEVTKRHVFVYAALLVVSSLAPWFLGYMGLFYGVCASLLGAVYMVFSWRVLMQGREKDGVRLFLYSIVYLFLLFLSMPLDHFGGRLF